MRTASQWLLILLTLASVHLAEAQQGLKIPRIGFLIASSTSLGEPRLDEPRLKAFRQGLRELGYIEGKNIVIEYRYAEGNDRIPSLVAELVQLKVDVLVVGPIAGIRAAKQATKTIPIVIVTVVDPVATRLIDSLARPGGNITGLTRLTRELSGKRLELLAEVLPRLSRVGLLWNGDSESSAIAFKEYEAAAPILKIQLQSLVVHGPNPDLEGAFKAAVKERATALINIRGVLLDPYSKRIVDLAIKNRMPSMYEGSEFVQTGGLMSYSVSDAESFRRVAGTWIRSFTVPQRLSCPLSNRQSSSW